MKETKKVRDIMAQHPVSVSPETTLTAAARLMREENVGGLVVCSNDGSLVGFITDRDLVVRGLASSEDPRQMQVDSVCTKNPHTLSPEASIEEAVKIMSSEAVRRIPVARDNKPIGVVTLGDLAAARDPDSALGAISQAPAQS